MADLHIWIRNAAGNYAGELDAYGATETIADVQARLAAGLTALDKATNARPPDAAAIIAANTTQAKAKWAAAPAASKTDALRAIALMLGIENPA